MNQYSLGMSNLGLHLLCLWRHNAAKSMLRRLGDECNFPGAMLYWRIEAGERLGTVFHHSSQAKALNME